MPTPLPVSVPTPVLPPTPPVEYPTPLTPSPTAAAPPADSEAECCFLGGCASYGSLSCHSVGSWCSQSSDNCQVCAGTYCTEMDWWDTQPSSTSTSAPTAEYQC